MNIFGLSKKPKTIPNDPALRIKVLSADKIAGKNKTRIMAELHAGTICNGNTLIYTHRDTFESFERVILGLIDSNANDVPMIAWQDNTQDSRVNMCAIEVDYIDAPGTYIDDSLPFDEAVAIAEMRDIETLEKGPLFSVKNKL